MTLAISPGVGAAEFAGVADVLDNTVEVSLVSAGCAPVELPTQLREVLTAAARALADGREVFVGSGDAYLTAQEAADFLGVSRPTLNRILDMGSIPFQRPNSHRRIRLADLVRYQAKQGQRQVAIDELLAQSGDELDGYDTDQLVETR